MRMIVMFDLPVETKADQKEYRRFHKLLISNGFMMLQYSIYVRYCINDSALKKYINRIKHQKPSSGNVRILSITENQYNNMINLVGNYSSREEVEKKDNLIIID